MWKSRFLRFPRTVGAEENLPLVFLGVHGPSFPQSFPSRRPFLLRFEASEQSPFRCLHPSRCFGIAVCSRLLIQCRNRHTRPEIFRHVRYLSQDLPGCCVPSIHSPLSSFCSGHYLRYSTGPVEV